MKMKSPLLIPCALLLGLLSFAGLAQAPNDEPAAPAAQLVARWTAADATCRSTTAPAIDAVGGCDQRDTLSKVLAQANYCHAAAAGGAPRWMPCTARLLADQAAATRATAQFQRMGGVFVLSALMNRGTQAYFIVDSGAATIQVPEEAVEEMKRNGTLTEADFMGQHRFILADGRTMQQRVFRLRHGPAGSRSSPSPVRRSGSSRPSSKRPP